MAHRTREEALFGAAVLRRKLERSGLESQASEIYRGVLEDLGISDDEVVAFLSLRSREVDAALQGEEL